MHYCCTNRVTSVLEGHALVAGIQDRIAHMRKLEGLIQA